MTRTLPAILLLLSLFLVDMESAPAPAPEGSGSAPPADFHRGVNFAHIHRHGRGYGSEASKEALTHLEKLGVSWVAITPFAYQKTADADTLAGFDGRDIDTDYFRGRDPSLTEEDLKRQVEQAHELGVRVMIKPHIWSGDFRDGEHWHGTVEARDEAGRSRWWASYRAYILHHADLAAEAGADGLCIGTELVRVTARDADRWRALIREVRGQFKGHVTYAAHWHEEFEAIGFWDDLDSIGVCAYFPLKAEEGASVAELERAWRPHVERVAKVQAKYRKPVIFLEVGYRAAAGSFQEPWKYEGGEYDEATQARAYEAMFRVWSGQPWWRGAYLWKAFTDGRRDARDPFGFVGREAEAVVDRWYAGDSAADERR